VFDIKWIRDNADVFNAAMTRRGIAEQFSADKLVALDEQRRVCLAVLQDAQSQRNTVSKEVGKAKAAKDEATAAKLMAEVQALKGAIAAGEIEERRIDAEIKAALEVIPNLPREDVPFGTDEHGNVEVRKVGTPGKFDFAPKQHFEIGEALGMMDFEAAQKISGSRFVVTKGAIARLERALGAFMLDLHTSPAKDNLGGYVEHNPPLLVKDHAAYGTGNLPKFKDDLFETRVVSFRNYVGEDRDDEEARAIATSAFDNDGPGLLNPTATQEELTKRRAEKIAVGREKWVGDFAKKFKLVLQDARANARLWLIPTAEVSLTNIVRESILDEAQLPMRMTACTPCFRSEAGAAGKDTRGMIRQHQFTKVELVSITTPEKSLEEHERMTGCAEEVLKRLGLPFRTMLLCTGDMGFASQKTYDIEVWLPGQNAYREISSCSVCGDFQARRMDARYRPKDGGKPVYVHTLNGSGLAVGRTLVAVLENYQNADGSVTIPEALRPYMGGMTKISRA
jgi:seryl-tRNA synthetase